MRAHFNATRLLVACMAASFTFACNSGGLEINAPGDEGLVTSSLEARDHDDGLVFQSPPSTAGEPPRRQMGGADRAPDQPDGPGAQDDAEDGAQAAERRAMIPAECEEEELITATGPALVFNQPDALAGPLALSNVLDALSLSAGGVATQAARVAIINSALATFDATAMVNSDSGLTVPVSPRTVESGMDPDVFISDMLPVAAFNRLDLASETNSDCGEHRLVYSLDPGSDLKSGPFSSQKFTVIFEARYPNPNPALGLAGCQPVAEFWASLVSLQTNGQRASALAEFFLNGITVGGVSLPPVIDFAHFQGAMGQIRTNQFMQSPWQLREFRTDVSQGTLQLVPDTVKGNPFTALYNETASTNLGITTLREQFVTDLIDSQLPLLLTPETQGLSDPNDILVSFEPAFPNGFSGFTSVSQGSADDPSAQVSADLEGAIDIAVAGTGVSTDQILNRLGAMTCGGCHQFSAGREITDTVDWPGLQTAFVHVNDNGTLSDGLVDTFLPKRRQFLLETFFCDEVTPECALDDDCDAGFVCIDGSCVEVPPACEVDADCPEGEQCVEGECEEIPPECIYDADCGAGEVCADGVCVDEPDLPQRCRTDRDCPEDFQCEERLCVPVPETNACEAPEARVTGATVIRGSSSGQTGEFSGSCGGPGPEDTVAFRNRRGGTFCIDTRSSAFDTVLYVHEAECGLDAAEVACNDNATRRVTASLAQFEAEPGVTYFIFVDSAVRGGGDWQLTINRGACRSLRPTVIRTEAESVDENEQDESDDEDEAPARPQRSGR